VTAGLSGSPPAHVSRRRGCRAYKLQEVLGCLGSHVGLQLDFNPAQGRARAIPPQLDVEKYHGVGLRNGVGWRWAVCGWAGEGRRAAAGGGSHRASACGWRPARAWRDRSIDPPSP
jgi:hypothetical protein